MSKEATIGGRHTSNHYGGTSCDRDCEESISILLTRDGTTTVESSVRIGLITQICEKGVVRCDPRLSVLRKLDQGYELLLQIDGKIAGDAKLHIPTPYPHGFQSHWDQT